MKYCVVFKSNLDNVVHEQVIDSDSVAMAKQGAMIVLGAAGFDMSTWMFNPSLVEIRTYEGRR
jgi:hypothetical protein